MKFSIAYTFCKKMNELYLYKVEAELNFHIVNKEHLPSNLIYRDSIIYRFDKINSIPIATVIDFVNGASNLPSVFTVSDMRKFLYAIYIVASVRMDRSPLKQITLLESLNELSNNVFLSDVFIPLTSLPKPTLVYNIDNTRGITYKLLYNEFAPYITIDELTLDMFSESYYRNLPDNPVILEIPLGDNFTLRTMDDLKDKILSTAVIKEFELGNIVNLLTNQSLEAYSIFLNWIWLEHDQYNLLTLLNTNSPMKKDKLSIFLEDKFSTIKIETKDRLKSLLN